MILSAGVYGTIYGEPSRSQLGLSSSNELFQNDLSVALGKSISLSCTTFPCVSGEMIGLGQFNFDFGLMRSSINYPQPQTFYTDLLDVEAIGHPNNISSMTISNITASSPSDFGAIIIYSCVHQTNDPMSNCPYRVTVNSTLDRTIILLNLTAMPQQAITIEVSGFAAENASIGDMISFVLTLS